ncbi:hypothetical protein ZIOFF_015902 [Zingiber officinale]|uniref:BED-type domain-containing protein n=1 Tax=Zingiber officinale TaxID=94328 RepID=A0A8J5LUC9_ZINOF|nr:hypothetical protein ZIOFF_015902 [Zingiber officinale]
MLPRQISESPSRIRVLGYVGSHDPVQAVEAYGGKLTSDLSAFIKSNGYYRAAAAKRSKDCLAKCVASAASFKGYNKCIATPMRLAVQRMRKKIMSSSAPPVKKTRKNAPGARLDPAWKHGKEIDAAAKKVQCKYCNVIRAGGIYRLKHHLACTRKDVEPCPQVSDEVRKEMLELIRFVNWMKEFTKGKELVRPGVTRFATSYLTMRRLLELKGELIAFFASEKWRGSSHAKKKKGQEICNIIFDTQNFWPNVELCLKIASPLIKVLRMVDSDDKPAMGFLYKAIEHAKEEIKANLRSAKKR